MNKQALSLTDNDRELIHQLLEDVTVVSNLVEPLPSPSQIRATLTPVLRRWIAEGVFHRANKIILPHRVQFLLTTSPRDVKLAKAGVFEDWMALVQFGTLGVGKGQLSKKYLGADGKPTIELGQPTHPIPHSAHDFFRQKMFYWKEDFYTREDVIKMHANALGGVHLDFRRISAEAHITEIKNYFGFEHKPHTMQMLVGAEIKEGRADPARRSKIYDATELVVLDTARIFADGVRGSEDVFLALLR